MKRLWGILLIVGATGCSQHAVPTGAPGYWAVAHVEKVAPRNELEEDAAEVFYPAPEKFEPTLFPVSDFSRSGMMGPEGEGPLTQEVQEQEQNPENRRTH